MDHERVAVYTLNVTATDGGTPFNYASAQVIINIIDENDVVPTFDQTEYNSTIREDLQTNSIVRQLVANDDDSNENGQLTYTITSVTGPLTSVSAPDGTFFIDEATGTIRTFGTFDREAFEGPYTVMVSDTKWLPISWRVILAALCLGEYVCEFILCVGVGERWGFSRES